MGKPKEKYEFARKEGLQRHASAKHTTKQLRYECPACDTTMLKFRKTELRKHIRAKHPEVDADQWEPGEPKLREMRRKEKTPPPPTSPATSHLSTPGYSIGEVESDGEKPAPPKKEKTARKKGKGEIASTSTSEIPRLKSPRRGEEKAAPQTKPPSKKRKTGAGKKVQIVVPEEEQQLAVEALQAAVNLKPGESTVVSQTTGQGPAKGEEAKSPRSPHSKKEGKRRKHKHSERPAKKARRAEEEAGKPPAKKQHSEIPAALGKPPLEVMAAPPPQLGPTAPGGYRRPIIHRWG